MFLYSYTSIGSDAEQESDESEEEEEEKEEKEEESTEWCMIENKELSGYATGKRVAMGDLDTAKSACGAMFGLELSTFF